MAIHADTVWEFRATATASMVNGGGFNASNATAGTDYSQQDAAQDSGTDLACADGDSATPTITSATHNFVDADEGNIIHITAGTGWTAGWYEIVSTAGNAATLDRACGTDGAKTGGTWYLGGALSLNSTLDDDFFEQTADGNTIWFKNGSYTAGEALNFQANDGTAAAPIKIYGYNTTRGDNPTGTNRPLINMGAVTFAPGDYYHLKNLRFTGTASYVVTLASNSIFENGYSSNTSTTSDRHAFINGNTTLIINSEFISTNGTGIRLAASNTSFYGNYVHDSTVGIDCTIADVHTIAFNIIDNCAVGINMDTGSFGNKIFNNTLYGAETPAGTGISLYDSPPQFVVNNIIYGFTTGITSNAAYDLNYVDYNNFYNNTTDRTNVATGAHDTAVDPGFTDAANGNFMISGNI